MTTLSHTITDVSGCNRCGSTRQKVRNRERLATRIKHFSPALINGTSESCIRLSASSLIDQQIVRIAFVSVMDWRRYSVRAATVSVGSEWAWGARGR